MTLSRRASGATGGTGESVISVAERGKDIARYSRCLQMGQSALQKLLRIWGAVRETATASHLGATAPGKIGLSGVLAMQPVEEVKEKEGGHLQ